MLKNQEKTKTRSLKNKETTPEAERNKINFIDIFLKLCSKS